MRKVLSLLCSFMLTFCFISAEAQTTTAKTKFKTIEVKVPKRAKNQQDVINLTAPKLDTVRIGIIGLGMRGYSAVERFIHVPNAKSTALCDIRPEMVEKAQQVLTKANLAPVPQYTNTEEAWKELCQRKDVDLVYIVTDWLHHTPMALYAMQQGKHVAIEVPAALDMNEIWALIDMSEKTRLHCMMLEN